MNRLEPPPVRRVFVERTSGSADSLRQTLEQGLQWVRWDNLVPAGCRVFLKPNLTWREPVPGVTTTPAFIAAVVEILRERTSHITIGESDGGYHSFKAEEAFQSHGLRGLSERFGVHIINLSDGPAEHRTVEIAGRPITVEIPSLLLHDVDVFITLPVPKVHVMTRVSFGFKNQWGCQPGTMRLRNHPEFERKVLAINKLLRPGLALYDGAYFLDRTGPMFGQAVRMGLVVVSDDVGAGDLTCCRIMGFEPWKIAYLRLAREEKLMPDSLDQVELNTSLGSFASHQFHLERKPINWIALAAFRSALGTRLLYDSGLADPLHRILYTVRRNRLIGWLLYGSMLPPHPPRGTQPDTQHRASG